MKQGFALLLLMVMTTVACTAELADRGWLLEETVATAKMRETGMLDQMPFGAVFSKDSMRYQIFTSPQGSGLSVRVNVLEN